MVAAMKAEFADLDLVYSIGGQVYTLFVPCVYPVFTLCVPCGWFMPLHSVKYNRFM